MTTKHSHNEVGTRILDEACMKWRDVPSRTLARMVFNANPRVFSSIEAARSGVLYRRGRNSPGLRRKGAGLSFGSAPSSCPAEAWNPDGYLPKSEERDFTPFVVNVSEDTRTGVLGDIHVPYHNGPALRTAIETCRKHEIQLLILNGDTLDFHKLSRFEKDIRKRSPKEEVDRANQLLDALDDYFPKARKIWKDGNHDERFGHHGMQHAPEFYDLVAEKASLDKLLELPERGWEYVTGKRPIYLGDLTLIHGHEYPTPVLGPVNAARGLFLRTKACAATNHHHVTSEHGEPTVRGQNITTWSFGCLCELHPEYARFNKWNHGFAEIDLAPGGAFQIHNRKIDHGRLIN